MAPRSKDKAATKAAKFVSRLSRVNLDGTVERYGIDMQLLRAECFERDGWKCVICGSAEWLHMHHVKSRGLHGRDDRLQNVQTLCVGCHSRKHVRVKLRRVPVINRVIGENT